MNGELQLIFVLETNKKALIDNVYINEAIRRFYLSSERIHVTYIYLGGKDNYSSKKVLSQIHNNQKMFKRYGSTETIFFIDSDDEEGTTVHSSRNKNVERFCREHGFHLVWFVKDIEQVFTGKSFLSGEEKYRRASKFRQGGEILLLNEHQLDHGNPHKGQSNLLNVLDAFYKRSKK